MGADIGGVEAGVGVEIAAAFGLCRPIEPLLLVQRGAMGEVWRMKTDRGQYAIKRLFAWNPGARIAEEMAFTSRVRRAGLRVPQELLTPGGDLLLTVGDHRYRAFEWVDCGPPLTTPVSAKWAGCLGAMAGSLHDLSDQLHDQPDGWYTTPPDPDDIASIAEPAGHESKSWSTAFDNAAHDLCRLGAELRDAPLEPSIRCHRDLEPGNILPLDGGHDLAIFDWENLGPLPPGQEIGIMLMSWCVHATRDTSGVLCAFLERYAEKRPTIPPVNRHTFATWAITRLNFLVVQARASIDPATAPQDREFADRRISEILQTPLSLDYLDRAAAMAGA